MRPTWRRAKLLTLLVTGVCGLGVEMSAAAQSLRSSRASLARQSRTASEHGFTYLVDRGDVRRFVAAGYLVRVSDGEGHRLQQVSFPYARPEVRLFVQRLGRQYYEACSEKLVVTSLLRPRDHQPPNASARSVHPTGMALDLRRSGNRACRQWLERVLISLETRGVLEATRERRPQHYHVALFPNEYRAYLVRRGVLPALTTRYRVIEGDSLWQIARKHRTSVERIRSLNGLASDRLVPGQSLQLPTTSHRVDQGETLSEIALHYDTTVGRLQSVNGLSSSRILPGQLLLLPAPM